MSPAREGHLAMLLFALLVGGSYSISAIAAPSMAPAAITVLRFALASAILAGVVLALGRRNPALWSKAALRAPWRYLVLGGLLGLYFILLFEALPMIGPTSAAVVFALTPLMSAGFGRVLLHQRAPLRVLAPLLIAGLGAVWVIFRADLAALLAFDLGEGEAIFFVGCVSHALYTPMIRRLNRGEPVLVFALGMMLGGLLVVGPYGARAMAATDWSALPAIFWFALAYLAIAASAISFFLLQYAAMRLTAAKSMAYIYLVPSVVVLVEGLRGAGWPALAILPGVAATIIALLMLLRD